MAVSKEETMSEEEADVSVLPPWYWYWYWYCYWRWYCLVL